jgi:hypothetical protein
MARLVASLALVCGLALSALALAQTAPVAEYAIKSALLFKLPQFIYRPEPAREQPLVICLLGSNPFGAVPDKLASAPIDGRSVKFQKLSGTTEAKVCELVFIARSESGNLETILRQLSGLIIVTVSDIDGFAKSGGMVEFSLGGEGSAVNILINRKAAQKQHLEFNAQLLRLAKAIDP